MRTRLDVIRPTSLRATTCLLALAVACSGDPPSDFFEDEVTGHGEDDGEDESSTGATDSGLEEYGETIDLDVDDDADMDETASGPGVCGDGVLADDEACDDGNTASGDGCIETCRGIETGFVCPEPGQLCRAFAKCGDGAVIFPEQCDDGNVADTDGCNSLCKLEIGFKCEGSPSDCTETMCGDGNPEGAETCDDGNSVPFDGCSEICQGEPICAGEGCTSTCGDGLIIGDEQCDDGNAITGDGCSDECQFEEGYMCTQGSRCPEDEPDCPLDLPIVFRDFDESHSDFHLPEDPDNIMCDGAALGMVAETLDDQGKPTFESAPASACVENFADWYVDTDESATIISRINLYPTGDGSFVNRFGDDGEPYITRVDTGNELQGFGQTLAACETACASRARDGQEPFEGQGHLRCDDLCRDLSQAVQQMTDNQLNQANIQLNQAEDALARALDETPDDADLIAELEADVAAIEETIAEIEAEIADLEMQAATCLDDCETELAARTAECSDQCAPCSNNAAQFCIGGEELALDGDPLFFPIDDHPDAQTPAAQYGAAKIPAQIYQGLAWPWEGGECEGDWTTCGPPNHNFHFTSEIAYWFEYEEGVTALDLTFVGDDDVWVFVNGRLVIDLGGIHVPLFGRFSMAANGDVELTTLEPVDPGVEDSGGPISNSTTSAAELGLMDGGVYEIKVFHAERKPEGSSFQLTLSGFEAPRSQCEAKCGDGILVAGEQCDNGEAENTGGHNGCNPDCTLAPFCGDGIVQEDAGEQCDDKAPDAPMNCGGCRIIAIG